MIRTITLPHQCHCSDYDYKFNPVMATTYQEIEPLFSFRNVPEGGGSQMWCRACRTKGIADGKKEKA